MAGLRGPSPRTPSSSRVVRARSASASTPSSPRRASSSRTCSARGRTARPTGTSTCGAGSATPIRCRCSRSSRATRSDGLERLLLLEPALRRALRAPAEGDRRGRAQASTSPRCSRSSTTFACYHVLYYDNELHAYRTDKFAGWTNQPPDNGTAAVRLRTVRLHGPEGRQRSRGVAERRDRQPGAVRRRAGRPARPRPSQRRTPPRPTRSRSSWAWSRSSRWSRSRSCSSAGAGRNRRKSDAGTGRQPSSCGDEPAWAGSRHSRRREPWARAISCAGSRRRSSRSC